MMTSMSTMVVIMTIVVIMMAMSATEGRVSWHCKRNRLHRRVRLAHCVGLTNRVRLTNRVGLTHWVATVAVTMSVSVAMLVASLLELDLFDLDATIDPEQTHFAKRKSVLEVAEVLPIHGQSVELILHGDDQLEVVALATGHATVSSLRLPLSSNSRIENNVILQVSGFEFWSHFGVPIEILVVVKTYLGLKWKAMSARRQWSFVGLWPTTRLMSNRSVHHDGTWPSITT